MNTEPPKTVVAILHFTVFEGEQLQANPRLEDYGFSAIAGHDGSGMRYGVWDPLHERWRDYGDYDTALRMAKTFVNVVRDYYSTPPEIKFPEDETTS